MISDKRGIVYSCPVIRVVGTLALTLPFFAALQRGRFPILLVGLHADIVGQNGTRERHVGLAITRPCA